MPRKKKTRSFQATISGVTFRNEDGTHRQDIIRQRCDPGNELILSSEPNNPHGSHAVAVYLAKKGWFGGVKKYQLEYVCPVTMTPPKRFSTISSAAAGARRRSSRSWEAHRTSRIWAWLFKSRFTAMTETFPIRYFPLPTPNDPTSPSPTVHIMFYSAAGRFIG